MWIKCDNWFRNKKKLKNKNLVDLFDEENNKMEKMKKVEEEEEEKPKIKPTFKKKF